MNDKNLLLKKGKVNSSIAAGFFNTLRAIPLSLKSKGLMAYIAIPFILNIAVLSAVFYFSYTSLVPYIESFLAGSQWYMQFIRALVSPVIIILTSILTIFIYSILGGILAAPFLDLLSEKTEKVLGSRKPDEPFSLTELLSDILRALSNAIRLLLLILLINLVLLLLNIIPGGSFIYAFLNFLSALFFYGFQFYDFSLERRRYLFGEKLRITWRFKWSVLGTGLAFFLISFIPVIGFLGLNICTIGATKTFVDDIEPALGQSK